MSTLVIRKKSLKTWLHTDSILGDFIISKFYFNADGVKFQIVEQGQSKRVIYNVTDITLYNTIDGGGAETFSTITELSLRLEQLNYPAFQYDGQITSIANLLEGGDGVEITGDGTEESPYIINLTSGDALFLGSYDSLVDLETAHPVALNGSYAFVNQMGADLVYFFSTEENNWWTVTSTNLPNLNQVLTEGNQTDGENIVINNADAIQLENGSKLKKGTVNNGFGSGISQICTADKEMQWENGVRYLRTVGGTNVYAETMDNITPDATYDNTKGWAVGSYYKNLVTNDLYKCTDATTGSAVWELQTGVEFSLGDFVYRKNGVDTALLGANGANEFGLYTIHNSIIAQEDITDPDNIVYTYGSKIGELEKIRIDNDTFKWLGNQVAIEPIIKSANFTAVNNQFYKTTANLTVTDLASPVSGDCYVVLVVNGTATIGGVSYDSESLIYRFYKSDAWVSVDMNASGGSFVPYTGATADVDLDTFSLNAKSLHVKGTGGAGHLGLKHQSANITASASESSIGANSSGNPVWKNASNAIQSVMLENTAITGATKTKITYDAKGLVTSGTDATTADIADSTNKRYVTDAQQTVIGNTSGTNTGDETATTIRTKLGITTLSGSNTGDNAVNSLYSGLASSKQDTLVSGTNIKTLEGQSLLGSGNIDLTKSDVGLGNVDNTSDANKPVSTATQTALNAKQNVLIKQGYTQLTGVTGTQVLASLLIPADWLASGDGIEIIFTPNKSVTAASINFSLYHDTTLNGVTNAISTGLALTTSNRTGYMQRVLVLDSTTLRNMMPVSATSLTPIAGNTLGATTTFNPAVNNWITLTVNPTVGSEVTGFNQFFIRKL